MENSIYLELFITAKEMETLMVLFCNKNVSYSSILNQDLELYYNQHLDIFKSKFFTKALYLKLECCRLHKKGMRTNPSKLKTCFLHNCP